MAENLKFHKIDVEALIKGFDEKNREKFINSIQDFAKTYSAKVSKEAKKVLKVDELCELILNGQFGNSENEIIERIDQDINNNKASLENKRALREKILEDNKMLEEQIVDLNKQIEKMASNGILYQVIDTFNSNKKKPYVVELWDVKEELSLSEWLFCKRWQAVLL